MRRDRLRIALISPKGPLYRHRGGIWSKSLRYAPLTLTTLAALIPRDLPHELTLIDEGIVDVPDDLDVDLIGMTVITGSSKRAYELSAKFRAKGVTVVLGGPHITLIPEDAQPHADAVVVGYAEETWPQLIRDFAQGNLRARYDMAPNLSLAGRPFALRHLLPRKHFITNNVFEATRGCIHSCEFCVVPSAWGRKPYQKPVDEVVEDIRQHGARKLIFVDLNLVADPEYAVSLFEALIPLRVKWYGLATTKMAEDRTLLSLAARSGCKGILMGFESLSQSSLRSACKSFNHPDRYKEIVDNLHAHGISLQACVVFGADEDGPDVFERTAQFVVDTKIDLPRFAALTPFPGTPLFKRLEAEDRLLTRDWEQYDAQHVVFQPAHMSPKTLQDGVERAWKFAYRYRSIGHRIWGTPSFSTVGIGANLGYRFYAHNLRKFYTCDWPIGAHASVKGAVHATASS